MPIAIITGGSRGLGLALGRELAGRGWQLVVDARTEDELARAAAELGPAAHAVAGDVADEAHRAELVATARRLGGLDALVLNASALGPSPLPPLADYPLAELRGVYEVNVLA